MNRLKKKNLEINLSEISFTMKEDLPLAALVLVGGYGTRLRPLTFTRSKPLCEFCNRPMCEYMLDKLVQVGCKKIILALSELQKDLADYIKQYSNNHPGIEVIPSVETEALGTAGPLALALRTKSIKNHRLFVLNSDVISPYPFEELLEFHKKHDGIATIMGWNVEDGSRYGVIDSDQTGLVSGFREKPATNNRNCNINAGHYILEPCVVESIPERFCMIEREVFPQIAEQHKLYVMQLTGYWMDIGTPESFIAGIPLLATDASKRIVDPSAKVDPSVEFGEYVVIGPNVTIGAGCKLDNCVIMAGSTIGKDTVISKSIVAWDNKVGNNVSITDMTVTGEKCTIQDKVQLKNVFVCPYKSLNADAKPKLVFI